MRASTDDEVVVLTTTRFLEGLRARADLIDLPRRVAVEASRGAPELWQEPLLSGELEDVSVESLRAFLSASEAGPGASSTVPAAAVEFARNLARRRLGLAVLLNTYRAGHAAFWATLMAEATAEIADAEVRTGVLMRLWEIFSRWVDSQLSHLSEVHEAERDRVMHGALARRIQIVQAILAEEHVEPDSAEQAMGYDLRRLQTAVILWNSNVTAAGDAGSGLELRAQQLASAVGASRPLLVPSRRGTLWMWIATRELPSAEALAAVSACERETVNVAIGRAASGLDGFRRSHREALSAQRVALALQQPARLTFYGDVELLALLSRDSVAARTLVARELGELNVADRITQVLRTTALAFLLEGGNAAGAARKLGIHKNTAHYRLRRAEELLGRPITPDDTKLRLALELAEAFGYDLAGFKD